MPTTLPPLQTWTATVTRILDGDTFDVDWHDGYSPPAGLLDRIRIAGVDTNEVDSNQSFAYEATDRLAELLPIGTEVVLMAMDEDSSSNDRPVRHVFVDGVNIANIIIEEGLGLAVSYDYEPHFADSYYASGELAQAAEVGMWAPGASGGNPNDWPEIDFFVNYDAAGDDYLNVNDEYIQIRNDGPQDLDLSAWTIRKAGKDSTIEIPRRTVLEIGEQFRIYAGDGRDTATELYLGYDEPFLDNSGDVVYLRDADLNVRGYQLWPETQFEGYSAAIVIDTVQFDGPGNDETNPNGEWVVIRNASAETVDLTDWRLKDDGNDYIFQSGDVLQAGESLKIYVGSGTDGGSVRYWGNANGILSNDGGKLEIWTPRSVAVDAYAWGTAESVQEDIRGAIKLTANYDGPGSDISNPNNEWISLVNTSDSDIDLGGYSVKTGGSFYTFDNGTTLASGVNLRVMIGDGSDTEMQKFWGKSSGVLSNGGDRVELLDEADEVLLRHEWGNGPGAIADYGLVIEQVNFDAPGSDNANPNGEWLTIRNSSTAEQNLMNWKLNIGSDQLVVLDDRSIASGDVVTVYMGSGTDTADEVYLGSSRGVLYNSGSRAVELLSPTRDVVETHSWGSATSSAQSVSAAIDLSINYDAAGVDSQNLNGEWVNLRNCSSSEISLDGYHLYTDGTVYEFDAGDTIAAGERLRVYNGDGADSGLSRYANGTLNTFNNTADGVELRSNETGVAIDTFSYPFNGTAPYQAKFEISAVNYDAPGVDNDNVNGEWFEITNTGSTDIDLQDWRVQYQTGTFFDIEDSVVIEAGDTIRVSMGVGRNTSTNLFWGRTEAALSNNEGTLKLLSPHRVEVASYSWPNSFEGDDTIYGTSADETILSYGGDDKVYDRGGDDVVSLGAGNDYVLVGGGKDSFDGGTGKDYISYYSSSKGVTLNLDKDTASGSWASNDTISGFESASGSKNGDDKITGTSGSNTIKTYGGDDRVYDLGGTDKIELGSGDDYVRVGGGKDSFDGGSGKDYISYYDSTGGITLNLRDDEASGSWAVNDIVKNFESATGSGVGGDRMWGTDGANTLRGYGGDDRLSGRDGNDRLEGGDDDDTIYGGSGNDTLKGGSDRDYLDGGNDDDSLYGGSGADTFHFDRDDGSDVIHDFDNNIDTIELDNFSAFAQKSDAFSYATQIGDAVVFDFGADGSLTVLDTTINALQNDVELV